MKYFIINLMLLSFVVTTALGQQNVVLPTKTILVGSTENYEALNDIVLEADSTFIVEGSCELKAGVEILLEGEFEVKENAQFCAQLGNSLAYSELTSALETSFYLCKGGYFRLKFEEKYAVQSEPLNICFRSASNQIIYQPTGYLVNTGVNLFEFNLALTGLFTSGAYYVVEVVDAKERKSYLRIRY